MTVIYMLFYSYLLLLNFPPMKQWDTAVTGIVLRYYFARVNNMATWDFLGFWILEFMMINAVYDFVKLYVRY